MTPPSLWVSSKQNTDYYRKLSDVFGLMRSLTVATFSIDCYLPLPTLTVSSIGAIALPLCSATVERLRAVGSFATSGTQQLSHNASSKTGSSAGTAGSAGTPNDGTASPTPVSSSAVTAAAAVVTIIPPDKLSVSDTWHIAVTDAARRSARSLSLPESVAAAVTVQLCSLTIEEAPPQGVVTCTQGKWQAEPMPSDGTRVADFYVNFPCAYTGGSLSVAAGHLTSYDFAIHSRDRFVCFATLPDASIISTAITSGARVCLRYSLYLPPPFHVSCLPTVDEISYFYQNVNEAREAWLTSANSQSSPNSSVPRVLAMRIEGRFSSKVLLHSHLTGIDQLRAQLLSACGFSTFVTTFSCTSDTSPQDLDHYRAESVIEKGNHIANSAGQVRSGNDTEPSVSARKRSRSGSFSNNNKFFMSGTFAYRGTDNRISSNWVDCSDTPLEFSSMGFSSTNVLDVSSQQPSSTHAYFLVFCPSSLVFPLALSAGLKQAADVTYNRLRIASSSASALTEVATLFDMAFTTSKAANLKSRNTARTAFPSLLRLAVELRSADKVTLLLSDAIVRDTEHLENESEPQTLFRTDSVESISYAVAARGWKSVEKWVCRLAQNTRIVCTGRIAELASSLVEIQKDAAAQIIAIALEKFYMLEHTASTQEAETIAKVVFALPEKVFDLHAVVRRCIACNVKYGRLLELSVRTKNLQSTLCVLKSILHDENTTQKDTGETGRRGLPNNIGWSQKCEIRPLICDAFKIHGNNAISEVLLKLVNKYTGDAIYWLSLACHCGSSGCITKDEAKVMGDIAYKHVELKDVGDNDVRWIAKFILEYHDYGKFRDFLRHLYLKAPRCLISALDVTVEMKRSRGVEHVLVSICTHLRAPPLGSSFESISIAVRYMTSDTKGRSALDRVLKMSGLTVIHMAELAYKLHEPDEAGVRLVAEARDVAREAFMKGIHPSSGVLRGKKSENVELARESMKCAVMLGVLNGPVLVQWLSEGPKLKLPVHAAAVDGALDALAGVSFCDDSNVENVADVAENFIRRASTCGGWRADEMANIFAGYVTLCRHKAKSMAAMAELVGKFDLKVFRRCLQKQIILDVAPDYEWVAMLAKKRLAQIQNDTDNAIVFPNAYVKDHDEVTAFLRGRFSTMMYRKPFQGVAEARTFVAEYFKSKKSRRKIGAHTKVARVCATAGGRGNTAFVLLQKNLVSKTIDIQEELTRLYQMTGEIIDENLNDEDVDWDDREENGTEMEIGNMATETEANENAKENNRLDQIELIAPEPHRRSLRSHSVQNAIESEVRRHKRAMRENQSRQCAGKVKENGKAVAVVDQ